VEHDGWTLGVVHEVLDAVGVVAISAVYFGDSFTANSVFFFINQIGSQDMDDVRNLRVGDIQLFAELGGNRFDERLTFNLGAIGSVGVQQY
jgi:hypothetical protein